MDVMTTVPLSTIQSPYLETNMAMWKGLYPHIGEHLSTQVRPREIEVTILESGGTIVSCPDPNRRGARLSVRVTPENIRSFLDQVEQGHWGKRQFLILVGSLAGGAAATLARQIQHDQQKGLIIVEPVLPLLYAATVLYDLASLISSGNIFWAAGPDPQDEIRRLIIEKNLYGVGNSILLVPPGEDSSVISAHRNLAQWIQKEQENRMLCWIQDGLISISRRGLSRNTFQRAVAYVPRTDAKWLLRVSVEALMKGLTECSVTATAIPADIQGYQSPIRPFADMIAAEPDFLLSVNVPLHFYLPTPLWPHIRIPKLLWYVDIPDYWRQLGNWSLGDLTSSDVVMCYDRDDLQTIQSWGARHAIYLPTAADFLELAMLRPELCCEVSLIASVFDQRAQSAQWSPVLREFVDRTIEQVLASYPAQRLRPPQFGGLLSPDTLPRGTAIDLISLSRYLYLEVNNRRRAEAVRRLLPFDLHIYGQHYWVDLLGEQDARRCYKGQIKYEDSASAMASARVNLNVTSIQTGCSLGTRCFNVIAQRGCLVTEWVEGLDHLFAPGKGVVYYRESDELPDVVQACLSDSDQRNEIVERGRDSVLQKHTFRHRAEAILSYLSQNWDAFFAQE